MKIIIKHWIKKHQPALTYKLSEMMNSLYVYGNIYYHVLEATSTHLSLNTPYKRNWLQARYKLWVSETTPLQTTGFSCFQNPHS